MPPGHTDAIGRMKYLFQWTMELLSASDVKRFNERALELLLQGTEQTICVSALNTCVQ
jgi:hypothetical protein